MVDKFGYFTKIHCACVYGGSSKIPQERQLRRGKCRASLYLLYEGNTCDNTIVNRNGHLVKRYFQSFNFAF